MKKLFSILKFAKPYWWQAVIALVMVSIGSVIDLSIPRLIQQIIDKGIAQSNNQVVINTALIMLGITVLAAFVAITQNYFSVWVGEGFARDLREALFLKVQEYSYGNLDRMRTGQLVVRLSSDVMMLQRMVRMAIRIGTRAPILMLGSLIMIFLTNSTLALYIMPILVVIIIIAGFFVSRMGNMFLALQQKLDKLNIVLQENIAGVRVVKAFVRGQYENERFEERNQDITDSAIRVMRTMSVLFPTVNIMVSIAIVIVMWFGGVQVIEGSLTIGEIVAFSNYLITLLSPLMIMTMLSQVVAAGIASAGRVEEVLNEEAEIVDHDKAQVFPEDMAAEVVFEDVGFHYNGHVNETVLENINLKVKPGETVAILGATGSGKTSLINLIPRFYDVADGKVLIDGVDVRDLKQDEVLSKIGIVPQETVLFSGSVKDNIRYGRPEATDEEVIAAAKAAQAHDFIMELPDGYDTQIKARGVNLSGGQKQRVSIARALLLKPEILILDDSTSAVDVETEGKIQDALDELMVGRTSFVVAQRISTVLNADKIVVLDKGEIKAIGNHATLIVESPIYKEIYDTQLGDGFTYEDTGLNVENER